MDEQDVPVVAERPSDYWEREKVLERKVIAWEREMDGVMCEAQLAWERNWFIKELSEEHEYRKSQVREVERRFDYWADKENKALRSEYPTGSIELTLFHPKLRPDQIGSFAGSEKL